MQRYLVERSFAPGSKALAAALHEPARSALLGAHGERGVSWLYSYVTPDHRRSYCIVEGPSPEAVRLAARASGLPVDRICEVRTLDLQPGRAASHPTQE